MSEKKRITSTMILNLKNEGFSAEEVSNKLGMSLTDYKEACKIFNITGKHKTGVKARFELVDDVIFPTTTNVLPKEVEQIQLPEVNINA